MALKSIEKPSRKQAEPHRPAAKIGGFEVTPRFTFITTGVIIGVCVLLGALGAFVEDDADPEDNDSAASDQEQADPELNAGGRIACRDFRELTLDLDSQILTDQELREAAQDVNQNAEISEDAQLRRASEALLRSLTVGTAQESADAIADIHERCDHFGH